MANWFGIKNISSAAFGLPAGFIALVVGSLLTKAPSKEMQEFMVAFEVESLMSTMEEKTA